MHPEDGKSRGAGALFLVVGAALCWWAWSSAVQGGRYSLKAALVGPTLLVLGVGLLIHGRRIPTSGATMLTRVYGFAGGVATLVSLYFLGYFARSTRNNAGAIIQTGLPFLMLLVWFLPSRMFGPPVAPAARVQAERPRPTGDPIEPR
jgi:hypothetical protein